MKRLYLLAVLLLSACDGTKPVVFGGGNDVGAALDKQAIAAGLLPDPDSKILAGQFETRSDLGTDKFCAVSTGSRQFQIGFLAVFGPDSKCEARGIGEVVDDKVHIALTGKDQCVFDATYDGVELRFPGTVDAGCASYCSARASLSGTHYFMIQPGDDAARKTLGRDIEKLCD
jgi:hypothetical protein